MDPGPPFFSWLLVPWGTGRWRGQAAACLFGRVTRERRARRRQGPRQPLKGRGEGLEARSLVWSSQGPPNPCGWLWTQVPGAQGWPLLACKAPWRLFPGGWGRGALSFYPGAPECAGWAPSACSLHVWLLCVRRPASPGGGPPPHTLTCPGCCWGARPLPHKMSLVRKVETDAGMSCGLQTQ